MKNITHDRKIEGVFILTLFVLCVAVILPTKTAQAQDKGYDYPTAESSPAEIAQAIMDAINSGWSAEQIAGAANALGISEAQVQAATIESGIGEKYNVSPSEVANIFDNTPQPPPTWEPPPPPPQQDDPIILTSVYNGVTYTTNVATGNTTVAGNNTSIGYFNHQTGLYTDNQGNQVNVATLTGLAVSGTNAGGTVTTTADEHSYAYQEAMWSAGYNYLQALSANNTAGMRAAVEAANLAVRTEAGDVPFTVKIGPPVINTNPTTEAVESVVVRGVTYTISSNGSVTSPNGTSVGIYYPNTGTVTVTDTTTLFGASLNSAVSGLAGSYKLGTYDLANGNFTYALQTGVLYSINPDGSISYGCINTQNSTLRFPPIGGGGGIPIPPYDPNAAGPSTNSSGPYNDGGNGGGVGGGTGIYGNNNGNNGASNSVNGIVAMLLADPAIINKGQSSTLYWDSINADSCTGIGFTAGGPSGSRSTGALNDIGTHNYLIFCSRGAENSPPAVASVDVLDPSASISLIYAYPPRVNAGERSTIFWSLSNVHNCAITKNGTPWKSSLSSSGSSVETINNRTVYTMSGCTESDGTILPPRSVTVNTFTASTEEAYTEF